MSTRQEIADAVNHVSKIAGNLTYEEAIELAADSYWTLRIKELTELVMQTPCDPSTQHNVYVIYPVNQCPLRPLWDEEIFGPSKPKVINTIKMHVKNFCRVPFDHPARGGKNSSLRFNRWHAETSEK